MNFHFWQVTHLGHAREMPKVRSKAGAPRKDGFNRSGHSINPERLTTGLKGVAKSRPKCTIKRLQMYRNFNAKRHRAPFQGRLSSGTTGNDVDSVDSLALPEEEGQPLPQAQQQRIIRAPSIMQAPLPNRQVFYLHGRRVVHSMREILLENMVRNLQNTVRKLRQQLRDLQVQFQQFGDNCSCSAGQAIQ